MDKKTMNDSAIKFLEDRIEELKENIKNETRPSQRNFYMTTMQLNKYLLNRLQDEKAKALQSSKN